MPRQEIRRRFDREFREGAVRIVKETGKPIALIARELGSTRARWGAGSTATGWSRATPPWSRWTNARSWAGYASGSSRLEMERHVGKRSVVLWGQGGGAPLGSLSGAPAERSRCQGRPQAVTMEPERSGGP
jgi:transposase